MTKTNSIRNTLEINKSGNHSMIYKLLFCCWFVLCNINVYCNDSILVDREWTERITIFVNETEINSIGEDSVIENNGIACGYDGCKKIEFLNNHQIKKTYPNHRVRYGRWILKDDTLTITYNEREGGEKKKIRFKIKYIRKEECPTLYLFATKGRVRACYVFCAYSRIAS